MLCTYGCHMHLPLLSLTSLYYVSVKNLNSIKNIEHLYRSEKVKEASVSAQVSKF
jgi:hypothetical protein